MNDRYDETFRQIIESEHKPEAINIGQASMVTPEIDLRSATRHVS